MLARKGFLESIAWAAYGCDGWESPHDCNTIALRRVSLTTLTGSLRFPARHWLEDLYLNEMKRG